MRWLNSLLDQIYKNINGTCCVRPQRRCALPRNSGVLTFECAYFIRIDSASRHDKYFKHGARCARGAG